MCSKLFMENDRRLLFKEFWQLSDDQKNEFYVKFVKRNVVKRSRKPESTQKKLSFQYYFQNNKEIHRVCRTFFVNTLGIDQKRIYYCFKNLCEPNSGTPRPRQKGKHIKRFTPPEKLEEIRNHIKSFPVVESHYCRSSTEKKYLASDLTLRKMYNFYLEQATEPLKFCMYNKIFNEEFNYSFFKPKKDICNKCYLYKNNKTHNSAEENEMKKHSYEKNLTKIERDVDRSNIDPNHCVICYDLQNVFSLPKGNASAFFYKRKLNVFNLTATSIIPGKVNLTYCAIWSEANSGRGGNDISSALAKILNKICQANRNITKLTLWSDSCVPQNKNKINSTCIKHCINSFSNITQIIHKYSEPGHSSIQEVDCIHSVIEKYLKNLDIHSPLHLIRLLNNMNMPKAKLCVMQMLPGDFKSFSTMASNLNYSTIPFTKLKSILYEKTNPFIIKYKTSFADLEFKANSINKKATKKTLATSKNLFDKNLQNIQERPCLTKEKIDDIKSILPYLPQVDQAYYKALLKINL